MMMMTEHFADNRDFDELLRVWNLTLNWSSAKPVGAARSS